MSNSNWKDSRFYGFDGTLTEEQIDYIDSIMSKPLTLSDSVSGSGKTTLAVACAHYLQYDLLYVFFPVEEDKMGYRPGSQQMKESVYAGPLIDALVDIGVDPSKVMKVQDEEELPWVSMASRQKQSSNQKYHDEQFMVEAKAHIFMRGTNVGKVKDPARDRKLMVIVDECQNGTVKDLKKVFTRFHDTAKIVAIGHTGQCDLPDPSQSGFPRLLEVYRDKPYAKQVNLTQNFRGQISRDADEM